MSTWKLSAHQVADTADEAADLVESALQMQREAMERLTDLACEARQSIAQARKVKSRASDHRAAQRLGQALMWAAFGSVYFDKTPSAEETE